MFAKTQKYKQTHQGYSSLSLSLSLSHLSLLLFCVHCTKWHSNIKSRQSDTDHRWWTFYILL